jgi:hypothetical protein
LRYDNRNSIYDADAERPLIDEVVDHRRLLVESTTEKESKADGSVMDKEDTYGDESEVAVKDDIKYELEQEIEKQEAYFDYETIHEQLKIPVPALRASLMKVKGSSADM